MTNVLLNIPPHTTCRSKPLIPPAAEYISLRTVDGETRAVAVTDERWRKTLDKAFDKAYGEDGE